MVESGNTNLPVPRPTGPVWMTMVLGAVILLSGIAIGFGTSMIFYEPEEVTVDGTGTPTETPPRFDPREIVGRMDKDLGGLDTETQQKIGDILKETHEKMSVIRRNAGDQMQEVILAMDISMKEVLTEEQYTSWKKRMNKIQRHRRGPYQGGRGGRGSGHDGHRGGDKSPISGGQSRFMLEKFDRNKNGVLEKTEVPGDLWKKLGDFDKNGDDTLDKKELEEFRRTRMRDRRPFEGRGSGPSRGPGRGGLPPKPSGERL